VPAINQALPYLFGLVFVTAGSVMGGMWMGSINYLFELSSHEERPRYIALLNFLGAPGAFVPLLVGSLLEVFPFRPVFGLLAVIGLSAVAAAWRLPSPSPMPSPQLDSPSPGQ
jgi:hypothetical protein